MLIISLAAATLTGAFGAAIAYGLGFDILGIVVAYAFIGQGTFAVVVTMTAPPSPEDRPDFQRQIELDKHALREARNSGSPFNEKLGFIRKRAATERSSNCVPRPIVRPVPAASVVAFRVAPRSR